MKKRITALLLCALVLSTLMTSCKDKEKQNDIASNPTDISEGSNTDSIQENDDANISDVTPDNKEKIPESTGDTVLTTLESGYEILSDIDGTRFYIFTKQTGERYFYGIMDIDGNIVVEPTYTTLGWCPEHEVVYAEPFAEGDSPVTLDENHRIDLHYGHGGWGTYEFLFDESSEKFFRYYFNFDEIVVEEISGIDPLVPYVIYDKAEPIKEGSYYAFTDTLYDILAELGSDAVYEFVTDKGSTAEFREYDYFSDFTNDYFYARSNWKYGYIDGLGRESSEIIYEACGGAAYGGKAWVKKDGVWQVIKLK